jgi:hypothetical protein
VRFDFSRFKSTQTADAIRFLSCASVCGLIPADNT